ncbi:Major facilitator superfamily multidrug transporter [Drechslerella dactyloides]|uniref:Major facilitator superfamily multidrug transporter n=1 Tax=Drechslerella dactyloides TaxID=74499 RepID=A0AAD6IZQ7_DREDA|nr:Major facilitator superfamily multidrug transporter [Drechslerella dactyloides]
MAKTQPEETAPLIARGHDTARKPRLPVEQLTVLVICRLAEPITLTSILSYLPQMIRSFGVPEADVGFWVGFTASSFSVAQCMTGVAWGRLSDRVGRKPVILCGMLGMLASVLVFGFASSIAMAMISRLCLGLLNGNVGILRTVVAELVPERELQPQAFSLLPLTWSIGSIAGPILGGFLSEPAKKYPTIFPPGGFFDRHPFALPNLFTAGILFNALVFGALFLDETLVGQRHRYDPGRAIGRQIEGYVHRFFRWSSLEDSDSDSEAEVTNTVPTTPDEESIPRTYSTLKASTSSPPPAQQPHQHQHHPLAPLPWSQVLTEQSIYNIIVYFFIAIHTVSYDSILPVFFSTHSPQDLSSSPTQWSPLHIPGGFGLSTSQIGLIYSAHAVVAMLLQFYLYPPLARHFGSVRLLTFSAAVYPFIYLCTPYTLPLASYSVKASLAAWAVIILLKSVTGVFAFTSSTILITNTATSIRVLGTLNGFATSVAAAGRAVGPSMFGWLFSVGQKSWWTTVPWVGLAGVAGVMWIWIPRLEEGAGVRAEDSESSDEDE